MNTNQSIEEQTAPSRTQFVSLADPITNLLKEKGFDSVNAGMLAAVIVDTQIPAINRIRAAERKDELEANYRNPSGMSRKYYEARSEALDHLTKEGTHDKH